jgi:aromatic ring-opening dioxygenase LigB subunit
MNYSLFRILKRLKFSKLSSIDKYVVLYAEDRLSYLSILMMKFLVNKLLNKKSQNSNFKFYVFIMCLSLANNLQ